MAGECDDDAAVVLATVDGSRMVESLILAESVAVVAVVPSCKVEELVSLSCFAAATRDLYVHSRAGKKFAIQGSMTIASPTPSSAQPNSKQR